MKKTRLMARRTARESTFTVNTDEAVSKIYQKLDAQAEKTEKNRDDMKRDLDGVKSDLNQAIVKLGDRLDGKIDQQIAAFREELTKLNTNMDGVLQKLANHDQRIKQLEDDSKTKATEDRMTEKFKAFAWKAVCAVFYTVMIVGAACGIKPLAKIVQTLWQ